MRYLDDNRRTAAMMGKLRADDFWKYLQGFIRCHEGYSGGEHLQAVVERDEKVQDVVRRIVHLYPRTPVE